MLGRYAHCGNSYSGKTVEEVGLLRDQAIAKLTDLAQRVTDETGVAVRHFGTGSTPSCSHYGREMSRLTEMHPGNYVFYDMQQHLVRLFCKIFLE